MRYKRRKAVAVLCGFVFIAMGGPARLRGSGMQTIAGLGTTAFPTSTTSAEAQTAFLRGLLLLHLFEYGDAADAFVAAQKLDPGFAMAYWGEAMTFNHGVWNQVDAAAGKAALDRFAPNAEARAGRIADPREKAYVAAVELLYDGTGTKAERDARFSKAMERVSASYPDDRNAQLFYALALLSQSEGVRDVPVYLRAAAISKAVFRQEPQNPGAAHYWIHGMDDPDHAAGALEAARALSKIAPDAAHAQHMCSHIFMALGMWDDVVQANIEAMRVTNLHDQAQGFPASNCGHYAEWLEYGYFQQGRFGAAQQMVSACQKTDGEATAWVAAHPGKVPYGAKDAARLHQRLMFAFADMRNMAVVESQDWSGAAKAGLDVPGLEPEAAAWWDFVNGLAAAERGDVAQAHAGLIAMRAKRDEMETSRDVDHEELQALAVAREELSGFIQAKAGYEAGVAEIRHAFETYRSMPFAFGPPVTVKPPEELLGEVLVGKRDGAGARQAFEQALQRAPGRTLSLLGLARAERQAGDDAAARKTYQKLLTIWHGADADAAGVEEARKGVGSGLEAVK